MDNKVKQSEDTSIDKIKNAEVVYVSLKKDEERFLVCDVCGKKNSEHVMMCENCSNYLK